MTGVTSHTLGLGGRSAAALRGLRALVAAVFTALVTAVVIASPASAHGGPYTLEIKGDAAGGVTVSADYDEDGHRVEEIMDPVVTAVSDEGEEVGPIELISSSQGQGLWISEEPFMTPGTWTVTVVTTTPEDAETTSTIEVPELEEAPSAQPSVEPSTVVGDPIETDASPSPSSMPTASDAFASDDEGAGSGAWWLIAAAVVGALVIALVVAQRMRSRNTD
ncbi:hypothetical protein [Demequina flava]|uniref:hypothetical protein n=1 Tax=Demequina flava TaxID=1095025 RepID=UPI0007815CAF|nr:hypothetical protein [Demequina flava]